MITQSNMGLLFPRLFTRTFACHGVDLTDFAAISTAEWSAKTGAVPKTGVNTD